MARWGAPPAPPAEHPDPIRRLLMPDRKPPLLSSARPPVQRSFAVDSLPRSIRPFERGGLQRPSRNNDRGSRSARDREAGVLREIKNVSRNLVATDTTPFGQRRESVAEKGSPTFADPGLATDRSRNRQVIAPARARRARGRSEQDAVQDAGADAHAGFLAAEAAGEREQVVAVAALDGEGLAGSKSGERALAIGGGRLDRSSVSRMAWATSASKMRAMNWGRPPQGHARALTSCTRLSSSAQGILDDGSNPGSGGGDRAAFLLEWARRFGACGSVRSREHDLVALGSVSPGTTLARQEE